MKLKIFAAAAVVALWTSASPAQDAGSIPLVLTPSGTGTLSTTFDRTVTGLFIDSFTFTPASLSATVSVSLAPLDGPINFFSAILNGEGFSFDPASGQTAFAFESAVSADVPLELQVFGYAGNAETLTDMTATYRGMVSAQAVGVIPEPQIYGLMLAGLVAVGAVTRVSRRRESAAH